MVERERVIGIIPNIDAETYFIMDGPSRNITAKKVGGGFTRIFFTTTELSFVFCVPGIKPIYIYYDDMPMLWLEWYYTAPINEDLLS